MAAGKITLSVRAVFAVLVLAAGALFSQDTTPPDSLVIQSPPALSWQKTNFTIQGFAVDSNSYVSNVNIFTNSTNTGYFFSTAIITNPGASNTNYFTNSVLVSRLWEGTNIFFYQASNEFTNAWFSNYILVDTVPPAYFTNVFPSSNSVQTSSALTVTWEKSTDITALSYTLEMSTNNGFSVILHSSNTALTNASVSLSNFYTNWYYRVHADDEAGNRRTGPVYPFRRVDATPPNYFTFFSPLSNVWITNTTHISGAAADGETTVSSVRIFTNGTTSGFYYTTAIQTNVPGGLTNFFTNVCIPSHFVQGTNWLHFECSNEYTNAWFSNHIIVDTEPPAYFTNVFPASNSVQIESALTVTWGKSTDITALTYTLEMSTNSGFSVILHSTNTAITNASVSLSNFYTNWYYRVHADDQAGNRRTGPVYTFRRVDASPPDYFTFFSPQSNVWITNTTHISGAAADGETTVSSVRIFTNGTTAGFYYTTAIQTNAPGGLTNFFTNACIPNNFVQGTNWLYFECSNEYTNAWFSNHIIVDTGPPEISNFSLGTIGLSNITITWSAGDATSGVFSKTVSTNTFHYLTQGNSNTIVIGPLDEDTAYTITLSVQDNAGNLVSTNVSAETMVGISKMFSSISPGEGATNISPRSTVQIVCSKFMESSTINPGTCFLYSVSNSITNYPPVSVNYDNGSKTITITPAAAMKLSNQYTVFFSSNISTANGKRLQQNYSWSFLSAFPLTAPEFRYPNPGSTGISPLSNVIIRLADTIDSTTVNSATFKIFSTNGAVTNVVPCTLSVNQNELNAAPAAALAQNTPYFAEVTTGLMTTNGLHFISNIGWYFSTMSGMSGLLSNIPLSDQSNVSRATPVKAFFSLPMDTATINEMTMRLFKISGVTNSVAAAVTYNSTDFYATLLPETSLDHESRYRVVISSNVRSVHTTGFYSNIQWEFSTTPAYSGISAMQPVPGAPEVVLTTEVTVTFTTNILPDSVTSDSFYLEKTSDSSKVSGLRTLEDAGLTIRFKPSLNLESENGYRVVLTSGLTNTNNNPVSATNWVFSTSSYLTQPSFVVPASNAAEISLSSNISIHFSNTLNVSTVNEGTFYLTTNANGTPSGVPAVVVSAVGNTVIQLTPSVPLNQNTVYYAVATTGVALSTGSRFKSNYIWPFTTLSAMAGVTTVFPQNGSTNIPLNTVVSAVFPKELNGSFINENTFFLSNTAGGEKIPWNVTYDNTLKKISAVPSAYLLSGNTYQVTVSTNIRAIDGTSAGGSQTWTFTCAPPMAGLVSRFPTSGQTNVQINAAILFKTALGLRQDTLNENSILLQSSNGAVVICKRTYNSDTYELELKPAAYLDSLAVYTVTLTTNILATNGVSFPAPVTWSFTTIGPFENPSDIAPAASSEFNDPALLIHAQFQEALNPSTVNSDTVKVSSYGIQIGGTVSYSEALKQITFTPSKKLDTNALFTVTLQKTLTSQTGRAMRADYTWTFKTGELFGREGGRLQTADGIFSLDIPEKSLSIPTLVGLEKINVPAPSSISGASLLNGFCFSIVPETAAFAKIARGQFYIKGTGAEVYPALTVLRYSAGKWEVQGGTRNGLYVTFPVKAGGVYCLAEGSPGFTGSSEIFITPRIAQRGEEMIFSFSLSEPGAVIRIMTIEGQFVRQIGEGMYYNSGLNSVGWDTKNLRGETVPAGMYLIFITDSEGQFLYKYLFLIK